MKGRRHFRFAHSAPGWPVAPVSWPWNMEGGPVCGGCSSHSVSRRRHHALSSVPPNSLSASFAGASPSFSSTSTSSCLLAPCVDRFYISGDKDSTLLVQVTQIIICMCIWRQRVNAVSVLLFYPAQLYNNRKFHKENGAHKKKYPFQMHFIRTKYELKSKKIKREQKNYWFDGCVGKCFWVRAGHSLLRQYLPYISGKSKCLKFSFGPENFHIFSPHNHWNVEDIFSVLRI